MQRCDGFFGSMSAHCLWLDLLLYSQTCRLTQFTGFGLSGRGQLGGALDASGTSEVIYRFSRILVALQRFPGRELQISWAGISISVGGGQYRLCWCTGNECGRGENLLVDIGEMTFIGPSRFGRDRICGSGQTCVVDGIGAFGVSDGDKFFMLDARSEAVVRSRCPF